MLQQGDTARAEELVDQMVQGDPEGLDAAVWKVKVLNTLGKPRRGRGGAPELTAVAARGTPAPGSQLLMFQVSRGETAKARATLEQMKTKVESDRTELLWAACYRALDMRPEADEAFAAALKLWPDDPGVSQVAIDYYETTGRPELAEAALRHLLAIRPGFDWARRRLALNLSARPNNPAALSEALSLVGASERGRVARGPAAPRRRPLAQRRPEAPRRGDRRSSRPSPPRCPNPAKLHEALARSLLASSEQARAAGDEATAAADRARALGHAAKAAAAENAPADVILFNAVLRLQEKDIPGAETGSPGSRRPTRRPCRRSS